MFLRLKIEYLKGKYGYLYFERINEDNEIPNEKVEIKEENTNTTTENESDTSTNIKVGNKTLEYGRYIDYVNNEKAILNTTTGKKVYFEVINNNHMSDQWHELILTEN